ncbi:MAG: FAD:protein FMN transferase, partial [Sulfurimonadaceae bacterium]|nr:FAD:protein FMN transferase [Sulfurimonadaceae bacterium]
MSSKTLFLCLMPLFLAAQPLTERTQVHMGTFATITLPSSDQAWFEKSFDLIRSVEKSLSSYDVEADIARLNKQRRISIGPYTYEALSLSRKYYEESEGYFDITVGSITKKLYRFGAEERLVSDTAIQESMTGFAGL